MFAESADATAPAPRTSFRSAHAAYIDQLDAGYKGDSIALNARSQRIVKKLLAYPGPLSAAAARHDVAFPMGWISGDVYQDLSSLRKLRNKAAHSTDPFDDDETRRLLQAMKFASDL